MVISETIEERLVNQILTNGDRVNLGERIFYLKEGTTPTPAMRTLKMMGWKGQFEIR
jgi:hypothetical protein